MYIKGRQNNANVQTSNASFYAYSVIGFYFYGEIITCGFVISIMALRIFCNSQPLLSM